MIKKMIALKKKKIRAILKEIKLELSTIFQKN